MKKNYIGGIQLLVCFLLFSLCALPPKKTMKSVEDEFDLTNKLTKECAPQEYAAAKKKFDEAKKLYAEGKNSEAKDAALEARDLLEKAKKVAKINEEECLKRLKEEDKFKKGKDGKDIDMTDAEKRKKVHESNLKTVYFDLNESSLSLDGRKILNQNAEYLKKYPDLKIQIEGHCDARGSVEYNLTLGEKRAYVVKKYLENLGTNPANLSTISYGKEKPVSFESSEKSYSQNRRAEFLVQ